MVVSVVCALLPNLLQLSAGVDFSTLVGVRGFYYRATDTPDALSTKLNGGLSIYGANLLTRLNVPRGVTPYLSLGAGYLNVDDKYSQHDARFANAKSGWFALGGGGLEVPLHRVVSAFGSAEAMLMEQENPKLTEAANPSSIKVNWMYRLGLRFNLGLKAKNGTATYQKLVQAERDRMLAKEKMQQVAIDSAERVRVDTAVVRDEAKTRSAVVADTAGVVIEATPLVPAKVKSTLPLQTTGNVILLNEEQLARIVQRVLQATQPTQVQPASSYSSMSDFDKILLIMALRNNAVPQQVLPQMNAAAKSGQNNSNQQQIHRLQQQIQQLQQQFLQNKAAQKTNKKTTTRATSSVEATSATATQGQAQAQAADSISASGAVAQ